MNAALAALCLCLGAAAAARGAPTAVLLLYGAAFVPYAYLGREALRGRFPNLVALVAVALALRVALALVDPYLSDDIFRYVWEGRVTLAGFNPFTSAPSAAELSALRDAEIWPRVTHPDISTIYPPVAQYLFALVAVLSGGTTLMRLAFVAVEAVFAFAAWRLLDAGERPRAAVLYALNPLVIVEIAWSGHVDVLAWAPLALALLIVAKRPPTLGNGALAGAVLAVSIAAKLLGLMVLPYLVLRARAEDAESGRAARSQELASRLALLVTATLVVLVSYVPFLDAGGDLFRGFGAYAASWRNNDGLFRVFDTTGQALLDASGQEYFELTAWNDFALEHGFTKEWEGKTLPNTTFASEQIGQTTAKGIAALYLALVLGWCVLCVRSPLVAALLLLGTLYFTAPTVHPWYLTWLVPLAALRPSPAALTFSGAAILGYASWWSIQQGGPWAIPWWVVLLEYGSVFAVLVWELGIGKIERDDSG